MSHRGVGDNGKTSPPGRRATTSSRTAGRAAVAARPSVSAAGARADTGGCGCTMDCAGQHCRHEESPGSHPTLPAGHETTAAPSSTRPARSCSSAPSSSIAQRPSTSARPAGSSWAAWSRCARVAYSRTRIVRSGWLSAQPPVWVLTSNPQTKPRRDSSPSRATRADPGAFGGQEVEDLLERARFERCRDVGVLCAAAEVDRLGFEWGRGSLRRASRQRATGSTSPLRSGTRVDRSREPRGVVRVRRLEGMSPTPVTQNRRRPSWSQRWWRHLGFLRRRDRRTRWPRAATRQRWHWLRRSAPSPRLRGVGAFIECLHRTWVRRPAPEGRGSFGTLTV